MRRPLFRLSRCTPPNKSNEYQKIYSDWCHEFEKYKTALKSWEQKKAVSYYSFICTALLGKGGALPLYSPVDIQALKDGHSSRGGRDNTEAGNRPNNEGMKVAQLYIPNNNNLKKLLLLFRVLSRKLLATRG